MRDNGSLGSFEWDAFTFWNQGDVIADFRGRCEALPIVMNPILRLL